MLFPSRVVEYLLCTSLGSSSGSTNVIAPSAMTFAHA